MCDRTKTEILARELCITFWTGMVSESKVGKPNIRDYVEANWESHMNEAVHVLETIEKHKD